MTTYYVSDRIKTYAVNTFKNTFAVPNDLNIGLIFIGRSEEYANVLSIDSITDTVKEEKTIWNNMIATLEIAPGDVELVIPKRTWSSNTIYKQFDDTIKISELATPDDANNIGAFYVYTSNGSVYKCLSNNNSANSTIEPTGDYTTSNGFIYTADDYVWKYMYNVKNTNRFLTTNWIPVPYSLDVISTASDYTLSEDSLIDGALNLIVVEDGGSGYIHTTHNYSYTSNIGYLTVTDLTNVATGMSVSGTGILSGTYITSINSSLNRIYLSYNTTNTGTSFTTTTRVAIAGDGTGATAQVSLNGDSIEKIIINSIGSGYSYANVSIYGTSNNAIVRPVLPIKYGNGYSPAIELYAKDLMIVKTIGAVDSTEGGVIPDDLSFRQYGILMNPHKYNSMNDVTYTTANSVMSQTTDVIVTDGTDYVQYEYVYQGTNFITSTFSGLVVSQGNNKIRLTNVRGTPEIGALLKGNTVSRPVVSYTNPELQPYSGDILYVNNIDAIERASGQSEELKFIIKL